MTWRPASRRCRWGIHDWRDTGAMRGLWTLVDQCARCESWRTTNTFTEAVNVYPPSVDGSIRIERGASHE